jgi:hypothetical protein
MGAPAEPEDELEWSREDVDELSDEEELELSLDDDVVPTLVVVVCVEASGVVCAPIEPA